VIRGKGRSKEEGKEEKESNQSPQKIVSWMVLAGRKRKPATFLNGQKRKKGGEKAQGERAETRGGQKKLTFRAIIFGAEPQAYRHAQHSWGENYEKRGRRRKRGETSWSIPRGQVKLKVVAPFSGRSSFKGAFFVMRKEGRGKRFWKKRQQKRGGRRKREKGSKPRKQNWEEETQTLPIFPSKREWGETDT